MAIGNHNDLTHIVRTSDQWKNTYDKYELIPTGVLCVELVSSDVTKIKIGDGHNIFSKLPYIGDLDLSKYYTKLETDTRIKEILTQEKVVRIKGLIGSKSDLPADARCGDIYFVRQLSSSDNKYIEYIYSPDNTWEPLGGIPVDIDLSEYAKTAYVDDKIEQVNERIDDIEQHGTHTHPNKEILDQITEPYTTADKETLASLHNYDDTEIREMIAQSSHTHANKDILDATSAAFTREDKSKLDQLNPYDDSILKEKITELERVAHEHSNKRILDQTTASFTKEYERKMRWIRLYTGCTGMEEGIAGLVPAAQAGEEDYVLSGSGEWVPQTGGGGTYELPIATTTTLGGIKVGDGLEIDANGKLSVVGGGGGGDSIAEGDGITITTDPQTGVKTISVNTGDNLEVDPNTGELNVTGVDYEAGQGIRIGSNYNFLEYIKNSGNYDQIIPTDIVPLSTDKIELDIKFGLDTGLEDNLPLFGIRKSSSNPPESMSIFLKTSNPVPNIGFFNHFFWTESVGNVPYIEYPTNIANTESNQRQILTISQNYGTWGTQSTRNYSSLIDQSYGELTSGISVFGYVYNETKIPFKTKQMSLYGVKIYNSSNVLIHDLVPVERVSDNAIGLYDVLTNKFYDNAGNGSFIKGPVVTAPDRIINAKIGNGLDFDSNNAIEVVTGNGLSINQDNELEINTGTGLQINQDGEVEIDPSIIPDSYEAGNGIEITEVTHEDEFRVQNQEYFFDTRGLTCGLNARVWTTVNDGDILAAMCIHNNGGNQVPLFVGLTEDSVKVSQNYDSNILGPNGSFDYRGKTWYFTADYALSGTDGQDTQNHIQTLPTTYSFSSTPSNFVPAAKDLIDLAVLLPDTLHPTISAKIGSGLSFDANGAIQADAQPLLPATDSTLGGVIVGDGILVDNDGTISVDPTIIPEVIEYEGGTAISIENVEHGGVTFDAWDSGTGWENVCYAASTGNSVVSYQYEAHSPISNSYTLPAGATHIRAIAYDQNDTMLWTSFSWIDSNNYHFASTSPEDGHYNDWFEIPTGAVKVNFGVRHSKLNTTTAMSLNDIKSVNITVQTVSEIEVDVWNGGTGWLNGDYTSGNSDSFATNWYYTYHYNYQQYIEVPEGATHVMVRGISNENDSHFEGGGINAFDSNHHVHWWGCAWEWHEISSDVKYVQPNVKWNDNNTRTISGSDVKSVTLVWKLPALEINQAINVKYGDGLTVNQNNELEVNLGSGLQFDANGAIEVVGGGSSGGNGDYTAGDAIEFRSTQLSFNVDAIRWDISNIKSTSQTSGPWTQVRYIEFCDDTDTPYTISSASGIWEDNTSITYSTTGGSQTINDMIANTQKMCAIWRYPNHTMQLTFNLDTAVPCADIAKFRIKLGDDVPERDPKSWKVYFRDAATQIWYIVQDITDAELSDTRDIWSNYYPFDITGATSINVKYGTGLAIDPITGELFVDGQLPEGTIIKKLTYMGDGSTTNSNIHFSKKPLSILSLNGSVGQNYGSVISTPIDAPYLHGVWGGSTGSGTSFRSSMSYDDTTNTLSIQNTSDVGLAFNISGATYTMYYLTKGHTGSGTSVNNEVSVIKSFTYVGDGNATNTIQFPETPDALITIYGVAVNNDISSNTVPITARYLMGEYGSGGSQQYGVVSCNMSFNDTTNILTLTGGVDAGARYNVSGETYTVVYSVNEVISTTMPYAAGEAISIETIGGLQLTDYSNNDFVDSIASINAGSIVKAADKSSFTLTASNNDCYTRGSSGQANGSHPFNVKASTKYRFAWDSANPTVHGKVYTYENGLYDAMMHEIDQYDSSYLEFTTSANTTFIQARFGVMYAGDSITYSNVRLYEVIEDEDQYNEISVKHGDGLTVNNRNELEVNYGNGLEIVSNSQYRSKYYFNTQVQCQVHTDNYYSTSASFDRTYQKTTTEPALCCIWEVGDSGALWTGPLLVGTTATSVQYTTADTQQTVTYQNTFQYLGQTWYTSGYPDFLNAADHEDKLGYLQYLGSYAAVTDQIQAAKDLIDLALINAGSLQAKLGSGLSFDANGAIQVTGGGGGSGDTVAEGDGISITTDQQTGNKVIAINPGSGLQVNQTTNELEVSSGVVASIAPTQNTPGSITVTEGDGTTTPVSVISQMGGATSSTAGTAGYVPAPAAGDDDAYLRGDGTWDDSVVTEDDELTLVFVPDDYQPS